MRHQAPRWNGAVKTGLMHFQEDVAEHETLATVKRKIRSRMKLASYKDGSLDFRWLFSKYDLNRSGLISLDELRMAVRKELKISPASLSESDLALFYDSLDLDASGMLDIEEICNFLEEGQQRRKLTAAEEEKQMLRIRRNLKVARIISRCGSWKRVFERYDMDDDSSMSIYELERAVRTELKLTPWEVSKEDLKTLFQEMDQDRSKSLTVDEVCAFLSKKETGADSGAVSHLMNKRSVDLQDKARRPTPSLGPTYLRAQGHHLRRRPYPLLADCAPRSLGLRGSAHALPLRLRRKFRAVPEQQPAFAARGQPGGVPHGPGIPPDLPVPLPRRLGAGGGSPASVAEDERLLPERGPVRRAGLPDGNELDRERKTDPRRALPPRALVRNPAAAAKRAAAPPAAVPTLLLRWEQKTAWRAAPPYVGVRGQKAAGSWCCLGKERPTQPRIRANG